MSQINNRSEIVFIYDVKDNNPNGDPLNENMPRIDEETNINYVTDVRLKRTIRDFIATEYEQKEPNRIFMLAQRKEDETLESMKEIAAKFSNKQDILEKCIDIRLFGGTLAFAGDKKSGKNPKKSKTIEDGQESEDDNDKQEEAGAIAITGPVQFRIGRSMHKVLHVENQITRTVPNDAGNKQGTMGSDHRLFYSLIKFYGMVNENAAAKTGLSIEDVELMTKSMWNGVKALNTRTKIGHMPRILVKVDYVKGFFIGDLDSKIKLITDNKVEEAIRSCEDYELDFSKLLNDLKSNDSKIEKIYIAKHPDIKIRKEDMDALKENKKIKFSEILSWD